MAKGHSNRKNQWSIYKHDDRDYTVTCAECMQQFEAKRDDAVYCSARCRMHASRAPQRLSNCLSFIDGLTFTLTNYARTYKRNKLVFAAMVRLHEATARIISTFESVEGD